MVSSTGQVVTEQELARNIAEHEAKGRDASMFVWEYHEFAASEMSPPASPYGTDIASHMRHCWHDPKLTVLKATIPTHECGAKWRQHRNM